MASKNNPKAAADHLLFHMRHISGLVPKDTGVIPIILDGENAWETFADGGESFLRALYEGMATDSARLHSCTIEDYFRHHPPRKHLSTLHTGSWIGSNFDIWIGDPEENAAWNMLGDARALLQQRIDSGTLSPVQQAYALREIYAAEGSDWFWWYGPDFSTDNDALFDDLFRGHLKNVYALCGAVAPAALDRPIAIARNVPLYSVPERLISPSLDEGGSFFDWLGAGSYIPGNEQAAMHRAERWISRIHFGNSEEMFFIRIDLRKYQPATLVLQFQEPMALRVEIGAPPPDHRMIVFGLPLADLGINGEASIAFHVKVVQDGIERESYPEHAPIQFALVGQDFLLRNWIV